MLNNSSRMIEIVSAVAVVVSLIFVGFEIRNSSEQVEQNTQALQIAAYQDLIGRIVDINEIHIAESTSIESLVTLDSPTDEQAQLLTNFLWILFRHGDMAYFQFEQRAISEERMNSAMAPLVLRLRYPQVRAHWQENKAVFVVEYQEYIDNELRKLTTKGA